MINPGMSRNIAFRVETLYSKNGGRIGRLKCSPEGVFEGLPMMVLGEVTRQNTYYDPQSMVDQITSPTSRFGLTMQQGTTYGEWGHPSFLGLSDSDKIQRLVTVDEKSTSHVFKKIYTDTPSSNGTVVVRGDLKPTGPFGQILKESLDDPIINTAFSLRAYVDTQMRSDGVKYRNVRQLVTWDTVGASGYATTDKAHALALESLDGNHNNDYLEYEMQIMSDGNLMIDQMAMESFSNTDLNEIFGSTNILKVVQSRTFVEIDKSLEERFPTLYKKSLFNDYFKEG